MVRRRSLVTSRKDGGASPTSRAPPSLPSHGERPSVPDAVLRLQSVTKRFGTVTAVDRIDLAIERGEFFALLGPSGSGKTTMLRLIAGLEQPDAGSVLIDDRDVTALPPYARHIGMVFQNFLLFPHKTAAENIVFPLRMQRLARAERDERLAWALKLMRLDGLDGPLSQRDVRRPAAAGGAGARPDLPSGPSPARRAPRQSRSRAALGDGSGDPPLPEGAADPLHLRDPQPGGGADHERPHRGHAQRRLRADRRQDRDLY